MAASLLQTILTLCLSPMVSPSLPRTSAFEYQSRLTTEQYRDSGNLALPQFPNSKLHLPKRVNYPKFLTYSRDRLVGFYYIRLPFLSYRYVRNFLKPLCPTFTESGVRILEAWLERKYLWKCLAPEFTKFPLTALLASRIFLVSLLANFLYFL